MSYIVLDGVTKVSDGEVTITALNGVSFEIQRGFCCVVGPSGAGKQRY